MKQGVCAIDAIIEALGSQAELARLLGIPKSTVSYWHRVKRKIPAEWAVRLEGLTEGRFARSFTRPDLYGLEADNAKARRKAPAGNRRLS